MNRLFVENLTVIDFSYLDIRRGLLGESWIVDIELAGELDDQGMVFDFGHVKKRIKQIIDDTVDHKLVVPRLSAKISESGDETTVTMALNDGSAVEHISPASAICLMDTDNVNIEVVAKFLEGVIKNALPDNVSAVGIFLRTEVIDDAQYQYSHGLKKHQGNCQRIAHGHRSRLVIYRNGARDKTLETEWCEKLKDIYIGTREDIRNESDTEVFFSYAAPQGVFSLKLPKRQVYLIDTDSTVEWIATHIAEHTKAVHPDDLFRVKAFEGVGKGAIAER